MNEREKRIIPRNEKSTKAPFAQYNNNQWKLCHLKFYRILPSAFNLLGILHIFPMQNFFQKIKNVFLWGKTHSQRGKYVTDIFSKEWERKKEIKKSNLSHPYYTINLLHSNNQNKGDLSGLDIVNKIFASQFHFVKGELRTEENRQNDEHGRERKYYSICTVITTNGWKPPMHNVNARSTGSGRGRGIF